MGGLDIQTYVSRAPTPTVCGNHNRKGASATSGDGLATFVKRVPTPRSEKTTDEDDAAWQARADAGKVHTPPLALAVRRLPTPTTQDAKNNCSASQKERDALNVAVGGKLNPNWVEWLMGWPVGWTSLDPLPTENFKAWREAFQPGAVSWWAKEPDNVPRMVASWPHRTARLKAIGNGQVAAAVRLAWHILSGETPMK